MTLSYPSPLVASLQPLLPRHLNISLYHISHAPIKTPSLYSSLPGNPPLPTTLESHFLTASHNGILFFAVEVLIYVTSRSKSLKESTIFVSKADSSGFLPSSLASFRAKDSPSSKQSTLRTLTTNFLSQILSDHHKTYPYNVKTTISLFARAQNQYLFPNSAENKLKHVLDDRGLIRWWTKVLDPILQNYSPGFTSNDDKASAYLLVPGLDIYETAALFPPTTRQPNLYKDALRWTHGHPFKTDPKEGSTVREVIPHFPDDPKARFLDELNGTAQTEEERDKKKKKQKKQKPLNQVVTIGSGWSNVKTLDQFWELMNFRQECSMGRCVGFIWLVIERKRLDINSKNSEEPSTASNTTDVQSLPHSLQSIQIEAGLAASQSETVSRSSSNLILPSKTYDKITESLLHTDFGKESYARSHSRQWIEGAASLAAGAIFKTTNREVKDGWEWGEVLIGQLEADNTPGFGDTATPPNTINVVSVRRKRDIGSSGNTLEKENENRVNMLGAGLVRKKPKLHEKECELGQPVEKQDAGVHVLDASVVRKKPRECKDKVEK